MRPDVNRVIVPAGWIKCVSSICLLLPQFGGFYHWCLTPQQTTKRQKCYWYWCCLALYNRKETPHSLLVLTYDLDWSYYWSHSKPLLVRYRLSSAWLVLVSISCRHIIIANSLSFKGELLDLFLVLLAINSNLDHVNVYSLSMKYKYLVIIHFCSNFNWIILRRITNLYLGLLISSFKVLELIWIDTLR